MIADCVIDLDASRGLIRRGAEALIQRARARQRCRVGSVAGGVRRRGRRSRRRPGDAAVRRVRHVGRPAARALRSRASALSRVRRPLGDPPHGDRAARGAPAPRIRTTRPRRRRHRLRSLRPPPSAAAGAPSGRAGPLDLAGLGSGPLSASPLGSGHSNVTLRIVREGLDAVLRRPPRPPIPPSAHDVLRDTHPGARGYRWWRGSPARALRPRRPGGARRPVHRARDAAAASDVTDGCPTGCAISSVDAMARSPTTWSRRCARCTRWTGAWCPLHELARATTAARGSCAAFATCLRADADTAPATGARAGRAARAAETRTARDDARARRLPARQRAGTACLPGLAAARLGARDFLGFCDE